MDKNIQTQRYGYMVHEYYVQRVREIISNTPLSEWPLSSLLRGALTHFDLEDIYKALGKRLKKKSPWNAQMKPLN